MEQDLLQAQQLLAAVVAVAVGADAGRLQKPDFVVVVQGADGNARKPRHLFHRMLAHISSVLPRWTELSGLTAREGQAASVSRSRLGTTGCCSTALMASSSRSGFTGFSTTPFMPQDREKAALAG